MARKSHESVFAKAFAKDRTEVATMRFHFKKWSARLSTGMECLLDVPSAHHMHMHPRGRRTGGVITTSVKTCKGFNYNTYFMA